MTDGFHCSQLVSVKQQTHSDDPLDSIENGFRCRPPQRVPRTCSESLLLKPAACRRSQHRSVRKVVDRYDLIPTLQHSLLRAQPIRLVIFGHNNVMVMPDRAVPLIDSNPCGTHHADPTSVDILRKEIVIFVYAARVGLTSRKCFTGQRLRRFRTSFSRCAQHTFALRFCNEHP